MEDPKRIETVEEFAEWHEQNRERLKREHAERMAAWNYIGSPEHIRSINDKILKHTHEDTKPPWEDD